MYCAIEEAYNNNTKKGKKRNNKDLESNNSKITSSLSEKSSSKLSIETTPTDYLQPKKQSKEIIAYFPKTKRKKENIWKSTEKKREQDSYNQNCSSFCELKSNQSGSNLTLQSENIKEFFNLNGLGYDMKEILIIILVGIGLIFILDFIVRIGRKVN